MLLQRTTLLTAAGFTAVLLLLATADAVLTSGATRLPPLQGDARRSDVPSATKSQDPAVAEIVASQKMEIAPTAEQSLLARIVPAPDSVQTQVLLSGGDRLALFSWVESPSVKTYFNALKEALHASFSPQVKELKDEMLAGEGKPVVNFLTFRDPAIDTNRLVFLRVRQRLYEIHVEEGKDEVIAALLSELSR